MSKIILINIEGLDYNLIKDCSEYLPHLNNGNFKGRVINEVTPDSIMVWGNLLTGQNAGIHGIWGMHSRDEFSYRFNKIDSFKTDNFQLIHKMLPKKGKIFISINLPLIKPAPVIPGGYCISIDGSSNPEILKNELMVRFGSNITGENIGNNDDISDKKIKDDEIINKLKNSDSNKLELLDYFIGNKNFDCAVVAINGLSSFYKILYDGYNNDSLKEYYEFIDNKISGLLKSIPEDTYLMIFSNFSLSKAKGIVYLNQWLIENGLLTVKNNNSGNPTILDTESIDWSKTEAWCMGRSGQLYLNVKGREKTGIIEPTKYDETIDCLSEKLKNIPINNNHVLRVEVKRRDDLFYGDYEEFGPDLFVTVKEPNIKISPEIGFKHGNIFSDNKEKIKNTTVNNGEGCFILKNSANNKDNVEIDISALQITSTIFEQMDLEIPYGFEKSIFHFKKEQIETETEKKQDEEVLSRLESLGY